MTFSVIKSLDLRLEKLSRNTLAVFGRGGTPAVNADVLRRSVGFALVLLLAIVGGRASADPIPEAIATGSAKSAAEQIKRIAARLEDSSGEKDTVNLSGASWTLIHCADEAHVRMALKAFGVSMDDKQPFSFEKAVREAGGLAKYRRRVADLLRNDDEIVRGFAATMLSVVGDDSCKDALFQLLQAKDLPVREKNYAGTDRAQAAAALGAMGFREYTKDLAALLQDSNGKVQGGAALGLASLGAVEYADAIAQLLDRPYTGADTDSACMSAIVALARMVAKPQAAAIAKRLHNRSGDLSTKTYAIYALAVLDAKEQTKDLAALLEDPIYGGDAALALALLGASEYATTMKDMLTGENKTSQRPFDAAMALGILKEEKYAPDLARLLKAREESVRHAAAWALVLLESKEHAAEAVRIITQHAKANQQKREAYFPWPGGYPRFAAGQFCAIEERAMKSFRRLRKEMAAKE
jgi:HEAT repeat protein